MIYLSKNEKINKILKYFIVFSTIYFGRDTLIASSFLGYIPTYIVLSIILFLLLCVILLNILKKKVKYKNKLFHFLLIFILIISSMLLNNAFTFMYFSIAYAILYSFVLSYYFTYDDFFNIYLNIIIFLIIYSFFSTIVLDNIINFNNIENLSSIEFNNLLFCFVPNIDNYIRIFSVFREPGVYQYFILMCIYYLLIQNKLDKLKMGKTKLFILILGVISTFSVTGYICLMILVLIYIISKIKLNFIFDNYKKIIIIFICLMITVFLLLYKSNTFYWMMYSMISKIGNLGMNDPRVQSIFYNIKIFLESPIYGNDINLVLGGIPNNTSSLFSIFSIFGIISGSLYSYFNLIFLDCNFTNLKNSIISILKILFAFIILNSQCLLTNIYLYIFIILYYYKKKSIN